MIGMHLPIQKIGFLSVPTKVTEPCAIRITKEPITF